MLQQLIYRLLSCAGKGWKRVPTVRDPTSERGRPRPNMGVVTSNDVPRSEIQSGCGRPHPWVWPPSDPGDPPGPWLLSWLLWEEPPFLYFLV